MTKFDEVYNRVAATLNEDMSVAPTNTAYGSKNTSAVQNLTPQQKAAFSNDLVRILNTSIPKTVSTPNTGSAVASVFQKVKAAGSNALDVVGNMTVKDILGIAQNVVSAPSQVGQAALKNVAQAGAKTGQDIVNVLTGLAKQKGASDQEINQILNQIKQEQGQSKGPMSADRAAAGYED
jgi:hypothetical protein